MSLVSLKIYTLYLVYKRIDLWSGFRVLNSKLEHDCNRWQTDLLYIWIGILLLQYILVLHYTTFLQHSLDKFAKCDFAWVHWFEIPMDVIVKNMKVTISKAFTKQHEVENYRNRYYCMNLKKLYWNLAFLGRNLFACLHEVIYTSLCLFREANLGLLLLPEA